MRRYLIEHRRTQTLDLIDEDGKLAIERYRSGVRDRIPLAEFRRSAEGQVHSWRINEVIRTKLSSGNSADIARLS